MFVRAQRKKTRLRLSIAGLSGSGKTWSSLEIASGMYPEGKIALLDSEAGRGELYAEDFTYDVMQITAPYSPDKYVKAIRAAEQSGYDILIIDSLSHAWAGDGGVLSIAERGGGQFQNGWKIATPQHNSLVEAIIQSKLHIIMTMRSKSEYVVELNEKGKNAPRKVGLAPVQRDGLEYEMTIAMDINHDNVAHVTKDNTKLFNQQFIKPSREMGAQIMAWLNNGIEVVESTVSEIAPPRAELVRAINEASTLDELKKAYVHAVKVHGGNLEIMKDITQLKDIRKQALETFGNNLPATKHEATQ